MTVKYIEKYGIKVAFFPETKRFFKVNQVACDLIDSIVSGITKEHIKKQFDIDDNMYEKYYSNIFNSYSKNNVINVEKSAEKNLNRLVIHLTNDCNMRCRYCYANGGVYYSQRSIMDKAVLDKLVDRFFGEFHIINNIQFFGGEPLMNYELMEYACKIVSSIAKKRNYNITFGLVTNGTLIDCKFIDLVKKFNIQVTISYDGNPAVNDMMRIMEDCSGSSELILKNAKWLKAETGQPNTIEVTYNQYHVDAKVSILDIVKHIHDVVPDTFVHLVPAGGTKDCDYAIEDLSMFADSVREILNFKEKQPETEDLPLYSLAQRIFFALENRDIDIEHICDAGFGTISVSTKGEVYPCFMFTDDQEMKFGNIYDENLFTSDRMVALKRRLNSFSVKKNNDVCKECFIRRLCNGCLGLNSFHSGSPFVLSNAVCKMFRDMTEEAVIGYTKLFSMN